MTPTEILSAYAHLHLHAANEAETRLKIIDQVLFQVLGWTHADVNVEERVGEDGRTKFADYVLRTGMTAIVVEAKKVGVAFAEAPNLRRVQLRGKIMTGETGAAITQARDYARKLAIPFAIATNGDQWIVFPATRVDQVPFNESSAIIFPSLRSALQDDYAEFYDLLSRPAVINGALEEDLLGRVENQLEERRLNRFYPNSFSRINRHSFFPLIEDAVNTAFSEDIVNRDADLLDKCYVKTPDRIRFDSRIMMHIGKREAVTSKAARRPMKRDDNALGLIISSAAGRARPVAILVLGAVGVGKTTFLEYTEKVAARDTLRPTLGKPYPHWIKVDFRNYSKSATPLSFLLDGLKSYINSEPYLSDYERCIKYAYRTEIEALMRGPLFLLSNEEAERKRTITKILIADYELTQPYVEKILSYTTKNAPVFLVVDNIDQFEEEGIQASIFSDAMALAHRLNINLVCAMRESTYIRNRNAPTFDAFDFDPISIDAPKVDAVLSKRFFVARQLLEGQSGEMTAENGADFKIGNLASVIDLVQASVLGTEIGNLIDVLATSDIRLALRMTREFLHSGYTATGRALEIYHATGKYIMPQHEALRAILIGNKTVYSDQYSVIGNPFDAHLAKTEAQLLRLYVLTALVQYGSQSSFQYLSGSEVQNVFRGIGFSDEVALTILGDLCRLRFIHTSSHSPASLEASYLPSRLGGYIVRQLICNFTFVENVMMDTFISDQSVWDQLRSFSDNIYPQRDTVLRVKARVARAAAFFGYMKERYSILSNESVRRGLSREWCSHPLIAVEHQFQANLQQVEKSAQRNYGQEAAVGAGADS